MQRRLARYQHARRMVGWLLTSSVVRGRIWIAAMDRRQARSRSNRLGRVRITPPGPSALPSPNTAAAARPLLVLKPRPPPPLPLPPRLPAAAPGNPADEEDGDGPDPPLPLPLPVPLAVLAAPLLAPAAPVLAAAAYCASDSESEMDPEMDSVKMESTSGWIWFARILLGWKSSAS